MAPVIITCLQFLFDQQAAKARAIDEEVRFDDVPVLELDGADIAALSIDSDFNGAPLDPADTVRLAERPEKLGIEAGVELVGVTKIGADLIEVAFRYAESALFGGQDGIGVIAEPVRATGLAQLQPELMEVQFIDRDTIITEGMNVVVKSQPYRILEKKLRISLSVTLYK